MKVTVVFPHREGVPSDFIIWEGSSNGKFSMKMAYANLEGDNWSEKDNLWTKIWEWNNSQSVKHLL